MNYTVDTNRAEQLDLSNFKVGDTILFCDDRVCLWQMDKPVGAIKNRCPKCDKGLAFLKIGRSIGTESIDYNTLNKLEEV